MFVCPFVVGFHFLSWCVVELMFLGKEFVCLDGRGVLRAFVFRCGGCRCAVSLNLYHALYFLSALQFFLNCNVGILFHWVCGRCEILRRSFWFL
jgi:hypothetical protein